MARSVAGMRSMGVVILMILTATSVAAQDRLAITPVTIVDVTDGLLHADQTVLVEGDRIAEVGPAGDLTVPDGTDVVDGTGGYLIPGLWDMHAHASRNERAPRFWPLFLAHGVTGFRELGAWPDSVRYWQARAERSAADAPRMYAAGAVLDSDPRAPVSDEFHIAVPDAAVARVKVASLAEQGVDFVKVYDGLGRDAYFAIADEARRRGLPFVGHVPFSVTPLEASDAGQRSFEHISDVLMVCIPGARNLSAALHQAEQEYGPASDSAGVVMRRLGGALASSTPDPSACGPLLDRMAANETWLTPTLTVYESELRPSRGDARLRWIPADVVEMWRELRPETSVQQDEGGVRIIENAWRTVRLAHEAGVSILAGTDASDMPYIFAGSSLHDELALLVEAGLSSLGALRAATLDPARFLGRTEELGTVEEGKFADLVLLDADPLEDIRNTRRIRAVVTKGRLLDRDDLDRLIQEVEDRVARER